MEFWRNKGVLGFVLQKRILVSWLSIPSDIEQSDSFVMKACILSKVHATSPIFGNGGKPKLNFGNQLGITI